MIFNEILDKKHGEMLPVFNRLLEMTIKNQTHDGDLLLIVENAGYFKYVEAWDNSDPYTIGPQLQGHSERTHYDFIGNYVKKASQLTLDEYLKSVAFDERRIREVDEIIEQESISIQTEMLIYLKIWESDSFIKKMYQLACLCNGEDYDWHFKILGHNKNDKGGLSRRNIIENRIIAKFQTSHPKLFNALNKSYNSQIRNAIAHSQYATVGRGIILTNHVEDKEGSIFNIAFDEWIDMFHETIMIFSLYRKMIDKANDLYHAAAMRNNKAFQIRINRNYPISETSYLILYTREHFKDWGYQECD